MSLCLTLCLQDVTLMGTQNIQIISPQTHGKASHLSTVPEL